MARYLQENRRIRVTTPLGEDELLLTGFHGHEEMSRLFRFELTLLSHNHALTLDKIIGSSVTVSLPVFTSFRITGAVKAAEASVSAERSGLGRTVQDIRLKTAEAYVAVLRARRGLDVAQSNVTALSAHARDVDHFHAQGLVPKNDVLAVQVALALERVRWLETGHNPFPAFADWRDLLA